ncbi:hypothetical protein AAVH_23813 [Aphelenchoides avenae]|nr:hypothetical protein AAVH_23813 [Aphelenchus avenae]
MATDVGTIRGAPCKVVDGFTMIIHRTSKDGMRTYWRCTKYRTCPGRGISVGANSAPVMTSDHNHLADPTSPEKRRRRSELKEAAAANRATPSMALASGVQEGVDEAVLQQMPTQRALQQVVHRVRKVEGASKADLPPDRLVLPEPMKLTLRNERFLLMDSAVNEPDKPRILAFTSPYGIELLKGNRNWCVDGTFYSSPKHFDSLVTINCFIGKSSLPAAYILLPDRRQETYERALGIFDLDELKEAKPETYVSCQ